MIKGLLSLMFCTLIYSVCISQTISKMDKIKLRSFEINHPVYYQKNGYLTIFEASDLLIYDTLAPLLNKYDMLQYQQDSVWINDLVNIEVYDSNYVWQQIRMKQQMNALYADGRVIVVSTGGKSLRTITQYKEDCIPATGCTFYYAEKKMASRVFEFFQVYIGCPDF